MQINSDDGIVGIYGRDGVDLHNGWEERDLISSQYDKGRRIIGRKENETYREEHSKSAIPSFISGKRVAIVAGYDPENQTKQNGNADVNLTGIYALSDNGTLLKASHDIKLNAAENTLLSNSRHYSQKSGPTLKISHGTLMAGYRDDKGWNDQKILSHSYNGVILGATQGDVTLAADNDIHTYGAQAIAGQDIKLYAKRIHIGVAQGEDQYSENSRGQSKGVRMGVELRPPEIRATGAYIKGYQAGKGKGLQGHQSGMDTATFQSTQAFFESPIQSDATRSDYNGQNSGRIGTNSGSNFIAKGKIHAVASESDIDVIGSRLFGQQGIELDAARDINIFAADGRRYHRSSSEQHGKGIILGKSSGFIGSTQSNTQSQNTQGELQASSLDSGGQIDIKAGRNYTQLGSRVQNSAGHNINITAQKINVVAASGDYSGSSSQDYRRKGFNIAGNNPSLDSLQAAANASRQGGQSDNRLIKVAATANSAMHNYQAAQQLSEAPNGGGLNIKIAYGQEHSHAEQQYSGNSLLPSTIAAGGKLNLTATGAGEASDINIIASDVYGSSGTHLKADHKINLLAGTENHQEQSSSYSNSWESGVALSVGGGAALGVTASTAESQQQAQGQQSHWRHSHVGTFDSHTTLESGDATTFKGAQALGQGVSVKAASLHIESLQDSGSYSGSAHSSGAGGTIGLGYAAGNAHYAKSRAQSDYRSIGTASGIYAGDDGFQVDIKGHTQLIGGTIVGSEAAEAAGKNSFVTGTLQLQDLQNHSHSSGSGISLAGGYSYDAKSAEPNRFNKSMGAIKSNSHENGTTHASINTANITIRDNDAQQALTGESAAETAARANLGMWTENAQAQNGAVARPDGQKLLQEMQIGAEVGREFGSMAPQHIALLAEKQGNLRKHEQNLLAQELDQRLLAETTDPVKQQTIRDRMNNRAQDISANQRAYDAWKEGGILRNATHGLTSFVGSGGAPDATLAGYTTSVLFPVLNKQDNPLINFMAGPVTGALLGGGNPGAIAAGANTDWHNRQLHPQEMDLIRKNAKTFAIQQNISEEQATSILTGETLRGVSDDYADLQENHAARAFLNQLPGAGKRTADGQHLFGVLDRNSDEYRNSLYNIRHVDSNADLYAHLPQINKAFDDGGDYILWRTVGENKDNYNKAEKKDVVELYEAIEKRVNTYQEKSDNLLRSKERSDVGDSIVYHHKAANLRNRVQANYPQARDHFTFSELYDRKTAYSRMASDAIAIGMSSMGFGSPMINRPTTGKPMSNPARKTTGTSNEIYPSNPKEIGVDGGKTIYRVETNRGKPYQEQNFKSNQGNEPPILYRVNCSFRGDMQVRTDKGFQSIASIRNGDRVWARNEISGLMGYRPVLNTINSTDPDTAYLVVEDKNGKRQTIVSDSRHPYFTQYGDDPIPPAPSAGKPYHGDIKNAYWVNAANLEAGHKLLDDHNHWQTVVSVTVKQEPLNSYNLEVDTDHTYFIRGLQGDRGIWVHNKDCWNQLPTNATMDKVGGQEVYRFTDRNRTVMVVKNDKWTPGGKEAKYYEVNIVDGKAVIANANKPDLYHSVGKQAKNEKGQFIVDPNNPRQFTGYDRPKLNAKTQEEIYKNYKPLPNGDYWDIKNNKLIEAPIDIGHGYGLEHRRLALAAEKVGLTQQEFNKFVNAHPEYFRLENAPRNRGHLDEKPGIDEIEKIVRDMKKFIKQNR